MDDVVVSVAGSAVLLWNTETNHKDYIWSKRNGYCFATVNYKNNLVACAEYGLNPECHIFRLPTKELVYKFHIDTTVRVIGMAFSRCGNYLVLVGGVPDFRISIFDVENNKKLVMPESKLPCASEDHMTQVQVKFNPSSKNQFGIISKNSFYFFHVHPAYEITERGDQKILGESFRLQSSEYKTDSIDLVFGKFIWDQYSRVHICTNQNSILQLDPKTMNVENVISLTSRPLCCLLTQKHLIVSLEQGQLIWMKIEPPVLMIGSDKDKSDQCLKVLQEIEQDFYLVINGNDDENQREAIAHMHYNKEFKTIIMGTSSGILGRLQVEAEAINDEEEEEEHQQKRERKTIEQPFQVLGMFHTKKINGLKELGDSTQLISISEDQEMKIWEATSQQVLAVVRQPTIPTALETNISGTVAFIGTGQGAFRAYDLTVREQPRLIYQTRFYEDAAPITNIKGSKDGHYILLSSNTSKKIFLLNQKPDEDGFSLIGFFEFVSIVLSADFHQKDGKTHIVCVLKNNLLSAVHCPSHPLNNRMEPITMDLLDMKFRRIDRDSSLLIINHPTGDIFVVGQDKMLKKYEFPSERLEKIDWKRPPVAPVEEHQSHSIGTTCFDVSAQFKFLATGGKDGNIFLRHVSNISQAPNPIKAHPIFNGGVTAICLSQLRSTIYSGGGDGSIFAWTYGGKPNPMKPVHVDIKDQALLRLPELEKLSIVKIKPFTQILREKFMAQEETKRQQFRQEMLSDLHKIKNKLLTLLDENERVTDIERLERDEFIVDVPRMHKVVDEGQKECQEIKKEAEKTVLRLELLRERVLTSTWNTMAEQQTAIKSILGDTLIFNYPVRKRTDEEVKKLNRVRTTRIIELKERLKRIEANLKESIDETEFSTLEEAYLMNRFKTKPVFDEDQSIQEAAAAFAAKDAEKKAQRDKIEQNINVQGNQNNQGKKVPILKITKGKLGNKTKKKDVDEDDGGANKNNLQQREIRGMEEMHWRVYFQKRNLQEILANLEKEMHADLIYEPFELYCEGRKRNQIELLKAVIFQLKEDFNKEFKDLRQFKQDQEYAIQEKNELITEILENLKQTEVLFHPESHILEDPEHILRVSESEIKVEKHLTKEEREILEEERRKQAEREALLKGDNVGQRGLKAMLGGTDLVLKKEKNIMEQEIVREDWMNKPVEDMTDEEKTKLKEFEKREKEYKEKQKKAWEQELKKLKGEIVEIQMRFEERLLTLFKKKLFVDVRIKEQELYIIRLVIMLHDGKETRWDEKKYREEVKRLEKEKAEKEELINTFRGFSQDLEGRMADDQSFKEQERELKKMFPDANIKQILNFVKTGKPKKTLLPGEVNPREQELSRGIVEVDPFSTVDKDRVKEIMKEEDEKENFDFEKDNVVGLAEDDFDRLVQERYSRAEMEKDKQKLQNQIQQLQGHIRYLEELLKEEEDKYELRSVAQRKAAERIQKIKYNYEVIIYLKQGFVEVPQMPVATDYKDAILVNKDVINLENNEIKKKGLDKVAKMNSISEFKTGLKKVRYQTERMQLEIKDLEERAKDVQLYRVTKQTQEIIQGKHQKKDEEDKKRLENQIKQLEENANKRIKTINENKMKLKKEIREKKMESEQLEAKARILQNNVDQRKQIMSLKSNTMNDADADPSKKIKEIAHKRKLLDIAKQQTEEIEVLRDELDRLRARTFPSFAHLHNKQQYPDQN